jgi:hypothetical protein
MPASVNVPIAGTGTLTIAVDRTGSGEDVMLSAQNLPTGIPAVPELTLPPNQSFVWNVSGFGPNTSADDAISATGLEFVAPTDFDNNQH